MIYGGADFAGAGLVATATTAAAVFARLGFVDLEVSPHVVLSVEGGDGRTSGVFSFHFDEAEAAGASGFSISKEVDFFHRAVSFKECANVAFSGIEGEITDIDIEHQTKILTREKVEPKRILGQDLKRT